MRLTHLSLTNFRNYARLESGLPDGVLILVGDNAQGKTSLLEAIYYLATANSPHASADRQLLNWFALRQDPLTYMKVVAEVHARDDIRRIDIRLTLEPNGPGREPRLKKTVLVNGLKKRVSDLGSAINVVMFLPQDMALVEGSPSNRRRYLDSVLCQVNPTYCETLNEYGKVLSQRNALLKTLQEREGRGAEQLDFWDLQLSKLGAVLITRRNRALEEIEHHAAQVHRDLTDGAERLRLVYRPAYDPAPLDAPADSQLALGLEVPVTRVHVPEDEVAEGLRTALQDTRAKEIERGMTLIGPHRDDYRFIASGIDLGIYGSRGQGRTAVLSLKLAEMAWMHDCTGEWPVLLLDEVMAELDPQRRSYLMRRLGDIEQAVLTTADLNLFAEEFRAACTVWQVEAGTIQMAD